jgi:hypothetical protein
MGYADTDSEVAALGPRLVHPLQRFRVKNGGWALSLQSVAATS